MDGRGRRDSRSGVKVFNKGLLLVVLEGKPFYASFGFLHMRIIMYPSRGKANEVVAFGSSGGKNLKL